MLRTAAFAGDPFHASASTTAPVGPSTAVAGLLIRGGLRSTATAEPTRRQISPAASPPPRSENSFPTLIALAPTDLGTPSLKSCQTMPTRPNAAPTTVGAISAATCVRRGPPAAATHARAAAGSAASIDLVSHAPTRTTITPDPGRPPARGGGRPRPARPPAPLRSQPLRRIYPHPGRRRRYAGWGERHQAATARRPAAPAVLVRDRQTPPIPRLRAAPPRPRPGRPWPGRQARSTPHQGRAAPRQAVAPARQRPSATSPLTYGATGRSTTHARLVGEGRRQSPMPGQLPSAPEPGRCATRIPP